MECCESKGCYFFWQSVDGMDRMASAAVPVACWTSRRPVNLDVWHGLVHGLGR